MPRRLAARQVGPGQCLGELLNCGQYKNQLGGTPRQNGLAARNVLQYQGDPVLLLHDGYQGWRRYRPSANQRGQGFEHDRFPAVQARALRICR